MRKVLGTEALNGRHPDQLVELLEAVFDAIGDAPLT